MSCNRPLIRDTDGEFSADGLRRPFQKDIELVPRRLPPPLPPPGDQEVLQAEDGFALLDESTGNFIFDDLKQ